MENRPIQLNCSVKSQTSQNSHFAVLWYVHKPSDADGKLILKTTHNSAFEYGTYAEEEGLRARLQFGGTRPEVCSASLSREPRSVTVAATTAMWKSGC